MSGSCNKIEVLGILLTVLSLFPLISVHLKNEGCKVLFYLLNFNFLCISTANSTQLPSAGSSLGAEKKKKIPVVSEEIPVERTALSVPDHFQLKDDKSGGASSSSQNDYVTQKLSSDISQLNVDKNNVNVTKPCLPEEYKPEKWMLADQESGVLSQLNLAIVGHHSCPVVNIVSIIWHCCSSRYPVSQGK